MSYLCHIEDLIRGEDVRTHTRVRPGGERGERDERGTSVGRGVGSAVGTDHAGQTGLKSDAAGHTGRDSYRGREGVLPNELAGAEEKEIGQERVRFYDAYRDTSLSKSIAITSERQRWREEKRELEAEAKRKEEKNRVEEEREREREMGKERAIRAESERTRSIKLDLYSKGIYNSDIHALVGMGYSLEACLEAKDRGRCLYLDEFLEYFSSKSVSHDAVNSAAGIHRGAGIGTSDHNAFAGSSISRIGRSNSISSGASEMQIRRFLQVFISH